MGDINDILFIKNVEQKRKPVGKTVLSVLSPSFRMNIRWSCVFSKRFERAKFKAGVLVLDVCDKFMQCR